MSSSSLLPQEDLGVVGLYGPHHLLPEAALQYSVDALETTAFFYKQETGTRRAFVCRRAHGVLLGFSLPFSLKLNRRVAHERQ